MKLCNNCFEQEDICTCGHNETVTTDELTKQIELMQDICDELTNYCCRCGKNTTDENHEFNTCISCAKDEEESV